MNTRARIATVCQALHILPSVERNRDHMLSLLDLALRHKPNLVCLPETFTSPHDTPLDQIAEPLPGPTTDAVARLAREHRCYVICPILTRRDDRFYNSAVLLDRQGHIAGIYDKLQPVTSSHDYTTLEGGVHPGQSLPVFDLDFGRIAIQICFDIGFPDNWRALADQDVRLVVWCSAYNGGRPLQAYATLHNYYLVSSVRTNNSRIINPCGDVLAQTDAVSNVICRDVNLDYLVCHHDFNYGIPERIQRDYGPRVSIRSHGDEGLLLIEPTDPSISAAQLQTEFSVESRTQYLQRHRQTYDALRQGKTPPRQQAPHGDRPMYGKS